MKFNNPKEALRYHVTGAIERGEGEAIVEMPPANPEKEALAKAKAAGEAAALAVWDRDGHVDRGSCGGAMLELDRRSKLYREAKAEGLIAFEGFVLLAMPAGIRSQNADIPQAQYRAFRKVIEEAGFGKAIKKFWTYVD